MTAEQAEKFRYNILDLTKVWPHAEFPLRPIGKLVLNENPLNYFAEVEQVCLLLKPAYALNNAHKLDLGCLLSLAPSSWC